MKTRVIAAVVLLPLLLAVLLILPGLFTGILFGLLSAIGAYELLYRTGFVKEIRLVVYGALMALYIGLWSGFSWGYPWLMLGVLVFLGLMYGELLYSHGTLPFQSIGYCVMAGFVIPFLLGGIARIRSMESGVYYVLIPFAMAFASDTGAYFTGCAIGKHKLAPNISPNKTVEGLLGGVASAVVVMMLYALVLQLLGFRVNYLFAVVYGLLGSLGAVFGDLVFSAIKRQVGIKDYGNLIPGHGGALDRFDSMTVVAPLAELLLMMIPLAVK